MRVSILFVVSTLFLFSIYCVEATPQILNMEPSNSLQGVCPPNVTLCVSVASPNGSAMNITFYSNLSGVWDYFYVGTINTTFSPVSNGTYCINVPFFVKYNTTYYWNVSVSDDWTTNDSPIFSFTTDSNTNCLNFTDTDTTRSDSWIFGAASTLSIFGILAYIKVKKKRN